MALLSAQEITVAERPVQQRQSYTPALVSLGVLYFMMGFITCLNDTLVPFFKKGFSLTYAESSLVQVYFFLTYAIMSIPAGRIVERTGYKNGMVLGFFIAAIGALFFFPASVFHVYGLFLAALFVIAIGIVLLQVAANPYITLLGPAETASSRFTLIQGMGSIGTTVAPLFGAGLILSHLHESHASGDAIKFPYLGIAALLILIALVVWRLPLPAVQKSSTQQKSFGEKKNIFSFRNLKFGLGGIFAYVGAEVAVGTFLTNYIADILQVNEKTANHYVAFYWGGMLLGRLLGAALLRVLRPPVVLLLCAVSAIALVMISVNAAGYLAVWSMIAVGICNSIMFATIFSLSVAGLGKYTTQASGLLSTAIAGGAIIPLLEGLVKDHYNWQTAFIIPAVCYIYILFYAANGYKPVPVPANKP